VPQRLHNKAIHPPITKQDAQTLASHLDKPRTPLKQRLTARQAHSHHLPATDVLSAIPTPHPRRAWTSQPYLSPLDPHDPASSLWNYKKNTVARFKWHTKLSMLCTNTKYNPRRDLTAGRSSTGKEKTQTRTTRPLLKKNTLFNMKLWS